MRAGRLPARAIESQVVWVSSNLTGRWGPLRFIGHAKVVDPDGRVLASTRHRPGLAVGRLDVRSSIRSARVVIDHLADRRPSAYATPPVAGEHAFGVLETG